MYHVLGGNYRVPPSAADSGKVHQVSMTEPHLILPGHRSIVNQVRYSSVHQTMATSGVEKVVKVSYHAHHYYSNRQIKASLR